MRFSPSRTSYASGFPATDKVAARRVRAKGDWLRRNGAVVLTNGSNAFSIDVAPYKKVSVESGEAGAFNIVGHAVLESGAQGVVLANFGSEKAAQNGHAALVRAHSGVSAGSGGGRFGWLKWGAGLAALFVAVVFFSAATTPMQSQAVAAGAPQMYAPQQMTQAAQAAQPGGFNPNEPTLEDLASGKYQFQPKLKAPEVAAPTLNCAPHK